MPLYIRSVRLEHLLLPRQGPWDTFEMSPDCRERLNAAGIGVRAPTERASSALCADYEREWRKLALDVLVALRDETHASIVWAEGPIDACGLPRVFPYMVPRFSRGARYHIEGVTFTATDGYLVSWLSYEFDEESFAAMMLDEALNLEFTQLHLLMLAPHLVEGIIATPFGSIGWNWVLAHRALVVTFAPHFDECYVAGEREIVDAAVSRLRQKHQAWIAEHKR